MMPVTALRVASARASHAVASRARTTAVRHKSNAAVALKRGGSSGGALARPQRLGDAFDDLFSAPLFAPRGFLGPLSSPLGLSRLMDAMLGGVPRVGDLERSMDHQLRNLGLPPTGFSIDIAEQDDKFVLTAELPGVAPSQLKVEVDDDGSVLTITAEKRVGGDEAAPAASEAKAAPAGGADAGAPASGGAVKAAPPAAADAAAADATTWHRTERTYGVVQRSLRLPPTADVNKITAKLDAGVLRLTIPKKAEGSGGAKRIAVEG